MSLSVVFIWDVRSVVDASQCAISCDVVMFVFVVTCRSALGMMVDDFGRWFGVVLFTHLTLPHGVVRFEASYSCK